MRTIYIALMMDRRRHGARKPPQRQARIYFRKLDKAARFSHQLAIGVFAGL